MPSYGYVRVSTVEQSSGTSLEEQRRKIQGVALMKGLELAEVYQEPGISGSLPLEARPIGGVLYRALQPGATAHALEPSGPRPPPAAARHESRSQARR